MPSACSCAGPPRVPGGTPSDYTMAKEMFSAGAHAYFGGKALELVAGVETCGVQGLGKRLMAGGVFLASLEAVGDLGGLIMGHDGLHPYDVRNASPERRAALRRDLGQLAASPNGPAPRVPADEADRIALQERLVTALQGVACPDDPCGWYRFGWQAHNALLERVLEDAGLAAALALAVSDGDRPRSMRLARIPQDEVKCNRFWFGFRDANGAVAVQCAPLA